MERRVAVYFDRVQPDTDLFEEQNSTLQFVHFLEEATTTKVTVYIQP